MPNIHSAGISHFGAIMEKENAKELSEEELASRIGTLLQGMKSADPEELEKVKSIVKRNVPFFTRSAFLAYLLLNARMPRQERKQERPLRKAAEAPAAQEGEAAAKDEPKRQIPEGAKTIYIDVGKMKHLYPKDLSRRIQAEIGITRDDIYQIRIHDKYSFVTMSEENCQKAIEKLSGQDINGRIAKVAFSNK